MSEPFFAAEPMLTASRQTSPAGSSNIPFDMHIKAERSDLRPLQRAAVMGGELSKRQGVLFDW